jgi:NTE family protein
LSVYQNTAFPILVTENCDRVEISSTFAREPSGKTHYKRVNLQFMKIGLALSGGAARGMAHVGVLKVLLEHNIPIDCVAGTSAGSLVGGAFASGLTVAQIAEMAAKVRWTLLGRIAFSRFGILSTERMRGFIRENLPVHRFEDMPIPFACVATDLNTGDAVVMKERGDLANAICASCAVPGLYVPVTSEDGRQLIDGGVVEIIPTVTVRNLGADFVIAVDVVSQGAKFLDKPSTVIGVFFQSAMLMLRTVSRYQLNTADIVIRPDVKHLRWDEVGRSKEFIKAGEAAALEAIDEIKRLIHIAS